MVGIPRDPQMARESYRLDELLRKTKILATEDYPKIGRRRTTIKLHAVRSLPPLRYDPCSSLTCLAGHVDADPGLRRLL